MMILQFLLVPLEDVTGIGDRGDDPVGIRRVLVIISFATIFVLFHFVLELFW